MGKNNPQDVIKTEVILGNLGDLDLDRTDGPTSLWGQPQEDPEAEERRLRIERLERKRAEGRAKRNMAEAADGGGEAPASEPPVTEPPSSKSPLRNGTGLGE